MIPYKLNSTQSRLGCETNEVKHNINYKQELWWVKLIFKEVRNSRFCSNHFLVPQKILSKLNTTYSEYLCVFRWATHLYMSLFLSVRPSVRPSVCPSVCPSVRPSVADHISGTIHHLIIILLRMCKIMISPAGFFIFLKFWFFRLLGE